MISIVLFFIDALFLAVPAVLCVALFSFVMLCVRWKTEHRRKHAKRLGVSLALIPLLGGLIYVTTWSVLMPLMADDITAKHDAANAKRFAETTLVGIGDQSPQFTLETLAGDSFDVPAQGRVTVLMFFATWCGPCLNELPHAQQIWDSLKDDARFQMIAINREESEAHVAEFLSTNRFTFPTGTDTEREIYSKFATESIPRTFIVNPDGTIAYATIGFTDGDQIELEAKIRNLLESIPLNGEVENAG